MTKELARRPSVAGLALRGPVHKWGEMMFSVLAVSTLDLRLFLCWTRVWSFMAVPVFYALHWTKAWLVGVGG